MTEGIKRAELPRLKSRWEDAEKQARRRLERGRVWDALADAAMEDVSEHPRIIRAFLFYYPTEWQDRIIRAVPKFAAAMHAEMEADWEAGMRDND